MSRTSGIRTVKIHGWAFCCLNLVAKTENLII